MRTLVDVEEARRTVLDSAIRMPDERVALREAHGRTLARAAVSDMDVPPFSNSAMDGYAARSADLPGPGTVLPLAGSVRAGEWPTLAVLPGTCWSITTGAPMPEGADTVVPVEETRMTDGGAVFFENPTEAGRHVRRPGRDVTRGETVVEEGVRITPAVAGMLAMVGLSEVTVRRRPGIAIVSTGDELVSPDRTPGPGQIRNSNAEALAAQAEAAGATVDALLHAPDDEQATREVLRRARGSDVVVFSGGVSMGSRDLIRDVLGDEGVEWRYWKVRQRPGKPLAFGTLEATRVFGLPGNPVSSSVCFDQYVRPLLLAMQGCGAVLRPRFGAVLAEDLPKPEGLHVFARGVAESDESGRLVVRPTGPQGSNLFTSVLRANCLAHLPAEWSRAPAGRIVEIEWLTW